MMGVETKTFKTDDLAVASVLSMHGLTPAFEKSGERATFVFTLADEDDPEFVEGLLKDLRSAKCRVEPKRFAREMKHVREMLYDFLNVDRNRLRLRQPS